MIGIAAVGSALLMNCGSSGKSSEPFLVPALNAIDVNDGYQKTKLASVDPGMFISLKYSTEYDTETKETVFLNIESVLSDSEEIPLSFYLIDAAAYKNDTQAEAYQNNPDSDYFMVFLGSDFYNYRGGQIDLVVPEDVPTGYYRILSLVDPNNTRNVMTREGVKTSYMSDSFLVTNADSGWAEITNFSATTKVAVYSDSDWLRNGKPYLYDTQVTYSNIIDTTAPGYDANDSSTWAAATTTIGDTKIINRQGHIQVNFDLTLRGKLAQVKDTTYVSFYLELWQHESAADSSQYWPGLGIDQAWLEANYNQKFYAADDRWWVTPTTIWQEIQVLYKGDSNTPDRFDWYYPVAASSDSKYISDTTVEPPAYILPNDIIDSTPPLYSYYDRGKGKTQVTNSFAVDLWIPDTTAQIIDSIYAQTGKSVWRLVMYVENAEAGLIQESWDVAEQFRAMDYLRMVKINYHDLFPDGSRSPKYAGSSWYKFNNIKIGIDRNDYTSSGGGFGCKFANYDEFYAAAGRDGGFIQEDNVQYIDVTIFGRQIPILDVKNVYKGIAYDIPSSYRQYYYKVGPWVLFSKYDELDDNDFIGTNAEPFVEWSKDIVKVEKTFMVGPVPLTPAASISTNVGINLSRGLFKLSTAKYGCGFGGVNVVADAWKWDGFSVYSSGSNFVAIAGRMTPYIALVAGVELAVGGEALKAGVYGSLDILRYELPIYLGTYAQPLVADKIRDGDDCLNAWNIASNRKIKSGHFFRIDLRQSTLSGSIGLFAEIGIPYPRICWSCGSVWKCEVCVPYPCGINWATSRYELPIVSWTGLWTNTILLNKTFNNQTLSCL